LLANLADHRLAVALGPDAEPVKWVHANLAVWRLESAADDVAKATIAFFSPLGPCSAANELPAF
jgi:hypothetical protein